MFALWLLVCLCFASETHTFVVFRFTFSVPTHIYTRQTSHVRSQRCAAKLFYCQRPHAHPMLSVYPSVSPRPARSIYRVITTNTWAINPPYGIELGLPRQAPQ